MKKSVKIFAAVSALSLFSAIAMSCGSTAAVAEPAAETAAEAIEEKADEIS